MPSLKDLTGKRFGALVVIGRDANKHNREVYWNCRCDCGATVSASGHFLKTGWKTNCGCTPLREQHRHCAVDSKGTPEYRAWCYMKTRATNPHAARRPNDNYVELGICERWKTSFTAFLEDLGPKPSLSHSLDRIDVNAGYFPGNVRWATRSEQANNKRNNNRITIDGTTKTVAEWAREVGLSPYTIYDRVRHGVALSDLLVRRLNKRRK